MILQELFHAEANVCRDLAQERRRYVATPVEWNGGATTVGMTKLLVRAALADFNETKLLEKPDNLLRLQNRNGRHASCNPDLAHSDKLGLQYGLTVLEQHF